MRKKSRQGRAHGSELNFHTNKNTQTNIGMDGYCEQKPNQSDGCELNILQYDCTNDVHCTHNEMP